MDESERTRLKSDLYHSSVVPSDLFRRSMTSTMKGRRGRPDYQWSESPLSLGPTHIQGLTSVSLSQGGERDLSGQDGVSYNLLS